MKEKECKYINRQRWSDFFCLFVSVVFLVFFYVNKSTIFNSDASLSPWIKLGILLFFLLFGAAITFLRLDFGEKWNRFLNIIYILASPCYIFLNMEVAIFHRNNSFKGIGMVLLIYNLAVIGIIELVLIVITNRVRLGTDICAFICVIFNVMNHFVYEFRGTPIMASDIATVGTALEVADGYKIQFDFYTALALVLLFDFILVGRVFKCKKVFKKPVGQLCGIAVMAIVCVIGVKQFVMTDFVSEHGLYLSLFQPLTSYRKYGSVASFSRSVKLAVLEQPEEYSTEKVEEITSRYSSDVIDEDKTRPNVIVIINEAFSDLQVLADFETNEDYMPFIHDLMENGNCVSGTAYTSIVGGQTANTEYEFLTGNSMAFLPSGSVAFQLFVKNPMPSLVTQLKSEGYIGNTAVHLQKAKNYNRNNAYPYLGFDTFYDYTNLEVPFTKLRTNASDQCCYNCITHDYEKYREESDDPYFGYTMTMQNHSSYDVPFDDFDQRISVENMDVADVSYYLSLIKYSDEAFEELINYYEQVDEPTVIFMTGDHQPRIHDASMDTLTDGEWKNWNDEEMMQRYAVPFVIWANYDIEKRTIEKTSMNYLQTILAETTGSELTGFQKFQQDIMQEVPVLTSNGYWGEDGNFYHVDDEESPYYDLLQEYTILQYNDLKDNKNRAEEFFNLLDE